MQFQLPNLNYDDSDTFFFLSYFFKNFFIGNNNFETTKARKLKFGDMISCAPAFLEALCHVIWGRSDKNL